MEIPDNQGTMKFSCHPGAVNKSPKQLKKRLNNGKSAKLVHKENDSKIGISLRENFTVAA